ncbi:NADH-ubiquinone oxidoreductase chain 1 [Taenia solium]|eukprot:TsM_000209100 transcript=TsM_000209100 gene=TsM_000209100
MYLGERRILGYSQLRRGPNEVGIVGLPQRCSGSLKLMVKLENCGFQIRR